MFRLGEQVGRHKRRRGGLVGQHHDLARPGQAVDGHLSENVFLGQGHEDVARPDDHVDRRQSSDAARQRRHRLCSAEAIHFADA